MIRAQSMSKPTYIIDTVRIPQPDGSYIIRPGKPRLGNEMVDTPTAARLLGLSIRTINWHCQMGRFRTARKPGFSPLSHWRIALWEVMERLEETELKAQQ